MAALHNIRHLCPSIANILINCYRAPTSLFIEGDTPYFPKKEPPKGIDPLGMPMYTLATVPLIKKLPTTVKQTWYADDTAGTGKIANLRGWWDDRNTTIEKTYRKHEMEKKRAYAQRVWDIEHSSFTPLVLSASGGFAREATHFYKRLASRLAGKWDQPYSLTMRWLRCIISFALLRSAIQCIRGARSSHGHTVFSPVDLVTAEANLKPE